MSTSTSKKKQNQKRLTYQLNVFKTISVYSNIRQLTKTTIKIN